MFSWLGTGNTWHVTPCIFLQIFYISLITRCNIAHGTQIHLFVYSFFLLTTKINYVSPTILTRRGEKEEIFWNDFMHLLPVFV